MFQLTVQCQASYEIAIGTSNRKKRQIPATTEIILTSVSEADAVRTITATTASLAVKTTTTAGLSMKELDITCIQGNSAAQWSSQPFCKGVI